MGDQLFQQEGGLLGPPAAFVWVEVRTGIPEPFQRLDQPLRVEREQGARVDLLVGREAVRAGPVLALTVADAHAPLEVVDLLWLDHARAVEQGPDNDAALGRIWPVVDG
ncbi:hypothetical protein AR276_22105 [Stenotrophomonas maltophilia]|nr:hypothetical protein AR276_22105 [Stenotrophomonas maltophilia]